MALPNLHAVSSRPSAAVAWDAAFAGLSCDFGDTLFRLPLWLCLPAEVFADVLMALEVSESVFGSRHQGLLASMLPSTACNRA